jgi:hypothetical protein
VRSALVVGAVLAATTVVRAEPCHMTVSFAPGASALTKAGKHTLDPLRDQLRAHHELRVQIVAAAAPISSKRTEAAKWYLVDGGIENDRIDTSTSGAVTARDDVQIAVVGASCQASASKDSIVSDASDLANLLAGSDSPPQPPPVKAPGSRLPPATTVGLHVGNDDVGFRGETSFHLQATFEGLPLALAALHGTTAQHHEDEVAREALATLPQQPQQKGKFRLDAREMRELSRCYRKALAFAPSTSNEVDLSFAIDRKGKVVSPMAVSDSGELDTCLDGVMAKWKFPGKSSGKNRIWLTVVLAPR